MWQLEGPNGVLDYWAGRFVRSVAGKQYLYGRELPRIRGFAMLHEEPSRQIRLRLPDGERITLYETEADFPSEKLLAQVMLVAGA